MLVARAQCPERDCGARWRQLVPPQRVSGASPSTHAAASAEKKGIGLVRPAGNGRGVSPGDGRRHDRGHKISQSQGGAGAENHSPGRRFGPRSQPGAADDGIALPQPLAGDAGPLSGVRRDGTLLFQRLYSCPARTGSRGRHSSIRMFICLPRAITGPRTRYFRCRGRAACNTRSWRWLREESPRWRVPISAVWRLLRGRRRWRLLVPLLPCGKRQHGSTGCPAQLSSPCAIPAV